MIEFYSHPYPNVVERLRYYGAALSEYLSIANCVEEKPPFIIPVLVYNGRPAWTPAAPSEWDRFDYTFIDVDRFRAEEAGPRNLAKALFALEQLDRWSTRPQPWRIVSSADGEAEKLAFNLMHRLSRGARRDTTELVEVWYERTRWPRRSSDTVAEVEVESAL